MANGTVTITAKIDAGQAKSEIAALNKDAAGLRTSFESSASGASRALVSTTGAVQQLGSATSTASRSAGIFGSTLSGGVTGGLASMALSAAAGVASIAALSGALKDAVSYASELESSMKTLQIVTGATGQNFQAAEGLVKKYSDAISSPAAAAQAVRVFSTMNLSLDRQDELIARIRDGIVAMGGDVNQQLPLMALAIKRQESALLDNMGVVSTIETMYKQFALSIGTTADKLTQEQRELAVVTGSLKELEKYKGTAAKSTETFAGSVAMLSASWRSFATEIGTSINPALGAMAKVLATIVGLQASNIRQMRDFLTGEQFRSGVRDMLKGPGGISTFPGLPGAEVLSSTLVATAGSISAQLPRSFAEMSREAIAIAKPAPAVKAASEERSAVTRIAKDTTEDLKREQERKHAELLQRERQFLDEKLAMEMKTNKAFGGGSAGEIAALTRARQRLQVSTLPTEEVGKKAKDLELDIRIIRNQTAEEQERKELALLKTRADQEKIIAAKRLSDAEREASRWEGLANNAIDLGVDVATGKVSAAGDISRGLGNTIGAFLPIPFGQTIGKAAGEIIGSIFDSADRAKKAAEEAKIKAEQEAAEALKMAAERQAEVNQTARQAAEEQMALKKSLAQQDRDAMVKLGLLSPEKASAMTANEQALQLAAEVLGGAGMARQLFGMLGSGNLAGAEMAFGKEIANQFSHILQSIDKGRAGSSIDNPSYTVVVNAKEIYGYAPREAFFRGLAPNTRRIMTRSA